MVSNILVGKKKLGYHNGNNMVEKKAWWRQAFARITEEFLRWPWKRILMRGEMERTMTSSG